MLERRSIEYDFKQVFSVEGMVSGNNLERKAAYWNEKGHFVEFPKKMLAIVVGRWRKYLGLLCSGTGLINNTLHGVLELGLFLGGGGEGGGVLWAPMGSLEKLWKFCLIKKQLLSCLFLNIGLCIFYFSYWGYNIIYIYIYIYIVFSRVNQLFDGGSNNLFVCIHGGGRVEFSGISAYILKVPKECDSKNWNIGNNNFSNKSWSCIGISCDKEQSLVV